MKNIEVIRKDITKIKLTITPYRISMKFPLNTTNERQTEVEQAFLLIALINKDTPYSLRGDLTDRKIRLCHKRRKVKPLIVAGVYYDIDDLSDARPVSDVLLQ